MQVFSIIINPYNSLYSRDLNFILRRENSKKNKIVVFIVEGFITFKVTFALVEQSVSCQCPRFHPQKLCLHVFFALYHYYKLPIWVIKLFHFWEDESLRLLKKPTIIEQKLVDKLTRTECGICLETLNTPMKGECKIYECHECRKLSHYVCLQRWFQKNKSCIYCRALLRTIDFK